MYNTSKIARISSAVVILAFAAGITKASAEANQTSSELQSGSKGEIHFSQTVKVGNVALKAGMYQVQHVTTANDHAVEFKKVEMPAGYRHGTTWVAKQSSARVTCKVQPAAEKRGNTSFELRTNAAGEKELAELQIAGESFRHLF